MIQRKGLFENHRKISEICFIILKYSLGKMIGLNKENKYYHQKSNLMLLRHCPDH